MAFPLLPIISAVAPALIGGIASAWGAKAANEEARVASREQMDFQKETLRHQYQWGMEDMKKAGLNPILAYKQGGAGSAGGSSYTPQNVGAAAVSGASTAQSSALATRAQDVQLENIKADTALKGSQDKTQDALQIQALAQAGQAKSSSALMQAQEVTQKQLSFNEWIRGQILMDESDVSSAKSSQAKADQRLMETELGKMIRNVGSSARELNPFLPKG